MKNLKANWPKNFPKPNYSNRFERNKYASILVKKYFSDVNTILNIGGGGKRHLEKCFEENSNIKITEVDFSGNNDLNINLDKIDKLPFENNSFDVSVALDSLEHFENFHGVFSEMFRISKKYIIISLPNSVETFFEILKHAKEDDPKQKGYYTKFYGLPLEKPSDRHRWFLTVRDIERFFLKFLEDKNAEVQFITKHDVSFKKFLLTFFLSKRLKKELRYPFVWILIKKNK